MTSVTFFDKNDIENSLLYYVVILARYNGKWIFCKHKNRETLEISGGKRAKSEKIQDAARRELHEKTGAIKFDLKEICVYSFADEEEGRLQSYSMFYFSEVFALEELPLKSEIEKILFLDDISNNLTYPQIQSVLFAFANRFILFNKKVEIKLIEYIENNIISLYSKFDKAHDVSHVNDVILNSMEIQKEYNLDEKIVYTIACYHDVGILKGRENHEINSAKFMLEDENLKKWFTEKEINIMAQAVSEHRASSKNEPKTIYGKIVSEADRDLEYNKILKRTILYSLHEFQNFTKEEHFERVFNHFVEKYSEYGYLKCWLNTEKNKKQRQIIIDKINNKALFKFDFDNTYNELIL